MIDISKIPNFYNYDNWDNYMAEVWAGLINYSHFNINSTVMEIAPGAATKIAKALQKLNFKGKYFIIEPHPDASQKIYKKSCELLPEAEVYIIKENFNNTKINFNVDYLLANHPFDDFIISYATNDKEKQNIIFQDISVKQHIVVELISQIWQGLRTNPYILNNLKEQVSLDFIKFIDKIKPNTIILSQYPSSYYERNNLHIVNEEANDLFQNLNFYNYKTVKETTVKDILSRNEDYELWWIKNTISEKAWKIYEKE